MLDEALGGRWPSLWPLLPIGGGLGLLLRRTPIDWIGGALTAITFQIMGGGAVATGFGGVPLMSGCGGDSPDTAFQAQSAAFADAGQLNVEFNCGTIAIAAIDGNDWTVSGTASSGRAPSISTSGSTVTIEGRGGSSFFQDVGEATWTIAVPKAPAVGLGVTLNAGEGRADLASARLTRRSASPSTRPRSTCFSTARASSAM